MNKDMGTTGNGSMDIPIDSHPSDVWWSILEDVLSRRSTNLETGISGGTNDDRFLRRYHNRIAPHKKPIKAISFSPIRNTPIRHHDNDEFVNKDVFLEGVGIYKEFVQAAASVGRQDDD